MSASETGTKSPSTLCSIAPAEQVLIKVVFVSPAALLDFCFFVFLALIESLGENKEKKIYLVPVTGHYHSLGLRCSSSRKPLVGRF